MEKDVLCQLVNRFKGQVFPKAYLEKAEEASREGNLEMARLVLERVLEIEPENHRAKELLISISYR